MKKVTLWISIVTLITMIVFAFSISGCRAEEAAEPAEEAAEPAEEAAEPAEEEPAEEEMAEEPAEEAAEEEAATEESPWYKGEGPYTLAWVPKGLGHPYFITCYEGAQEAAGEYGDEIFEVGPEDWSVEGQISVIESVIDQGVDAIGIAANDRDALAPVCEKAMDQGIPVIAWDAEVAPEARVSFVNQASFEDVGRTLAQLIGEAMEYEGKFAVLSATPQAPNQRLWLSWVYEELKDEKYANMELMDVVYGDDLPEKSYEKTLGLIKAYPDLGGILALSATATPAACQGVTDEDVVGEVEVAGFGMPSSMEEYIETGACYKFLMWNTVDLGYVAASLMHKTCAGEFTGEPGETVELGRGTEENPEGVWEVITNEEGEPYVLLGPPMIFDETNVGEWADKL